MNQIINFINYSLISWPRFQPFNRAVYEILSSGISFSNVRFSLPDYVVTTIPCLQERKGKAWPIDEFDNCKQSTLFLRGMWFAVMCTANSFSFTVSSEWKLPVTLWNNKVREKLISPSKFQPLYSLVSEEQDVSSPVHNSALRQHLDEDGRTKHFFLIVSQRSFALPPRLWYESIKYVI